MLLDFIGMFRAPAAELLFVFRPHKIASVAQLAEFVRLDVELLPVLALHIPQHSVPAEFVHLCVMPLAGDLTRNRQRVIRLGIARMPCPAFMLVQRRPRMPITVARLRLPIRRNRLTTFIVHRLAGFFRRARPPEVPERLARRLLHDLRIRDAALPRYFAENPIKVEPRIAVFVPRVAVVCFRLNLRRFGFRAARFIAA